MGVVGMGWYAIAEWRDEREREESMSQGELIL